MVASRAPLLANAPTRNDSGVNGLTRKVTYDPTTLRMTRIYAGSGAGASTNLQDLNYTFDNGGNIKSLVDVVSVLNKCRDAATINGEPPREKQNGHNHLCGCACCH